MTMRRPILPAVALTLVLAVPAAAHDTGLDGLYTGTGDDAHKCHHLRVEYWTGMIGRATNEIWMLRYDHARPNEDNPSLSELRQKMARSRRGALEVERESFATMQRQAKLYGCDPWPPSGK